MSDGSGFSHWVSPGGEHIDRAIAEGTEVLALCGHRWVPKSRDLDGRPICRHCEFLSGLLVRPALTFSGSSFTGA